jgi:lipopolysaccharide transport system ATP-binding protein
MLYSDEQLSLMNNVTIRVENLSKRYRLDRSSTKVDSLRDLIASVFHSDSSQTSSESQTFWAIENLSFEIKRGEVVGIIGPNGAGKSTLLKILSRITEPTEGKVEIIGRLSSLLEVGTGFHPELSGRENIYLNGAILGMHKEEITQKLDEVIEFSGIEKFIDTPVKRYSSGMYVRLAFAVAAHLDPEILLVDEVLAVGDTAFQQKCIGKMNEVAISGRTVLFVSHNMSAVRTLCSRVIQLEKGKIVRDGESAEVIHAYLSSYITRTGLAEMDLAEWPNRRGDGRVRILKAALRNQSGHATSTFNRLEPMVIEFEIESTAAMNVILSAVCFETGTEIKVLHLAHFDTPGFSAQLQAGKQVARISIPALPLQAGKFHWALSIHTESLAPIDSVYDILQFTVEDDLTKSPRTFPSLSQNGLCSVIAKWEFVN